MPTAKHETVHIRRYPNRRFYDTSRSEHITLEEIRELVSNGRDIEVTDTKSGDDITTKVLTQIILEFDAPKLDVFPKEMLYELIRVNDRMVGEFFEKYFTKAFGPFMKSQKQFESLFQQAHMINPFMSAFAGNDPAQQQEPAAQTSEPTAEADTLKAELEAMRREMAEMRKHLKPKRKRAKKI